MTLGTICAQPPDLEAFLTEGESMLAQVLRRAGPVDSGLVELATRHAAAVLRQLAPLRMEVSVAWPAGVPAECRDTIAAQIEGELTRALHERMRQELIAACMAAPELARATCAWVLRRAAGSAATARGAPMVAVAPRHG